MTNKTQETAQEKILEKNLSANFNLLKKALSSKNWENSITICEKLISICTEQLPPVDSSKTNPEKYRLLGDFFLDNGQISPALFCYNQAEKLRENLAAVYKKSGLEYLDKQDFTAAIDYFKQTLEIQPKSAENQSNLASVYAHLQQWEKAIYHYQEALKINPQLAAIYRNLARLFTKINQEKEANNYWYEAYNLEQDSVSAEDYYRLGHNFFKEHDFEKAIFCCQKTLEKDINNIYAYDTLGQIFVKQDDNKNALDSYEKLGTIFLNHGRYKEAITALKIAIKLSRKLGTISDDLIAKLHEAIDNYSDSSAEDYFELGKLLRSQSKFEQAADYFMKSTNLSPYFNESNVWLQYTPLNANKRQEVIIFYHKLLAKHPKFAMGWGNLGDFFTAQNRPQKAISCYQKSAYLRAINKNPDLEKLTWPNRKKKGPNYLIIGTAKSGTTSLQGYLNYHPQVILPHKKEIEFFNKYFNYGKGWYLSHFPAITDNSEYITGEATPAYLAFREVNSKVYNLFPNVKLIVLLRNPVDQVISWHYHKINSGIYQKTLPEAIADELKPIDNLTDEEVEKNLTYEAYNLMSCLYYYHCKRWLQYFPREQFLIIKSEDFFVNTEQIVQKVYNFLGLPEYYLAEYPKLNVGYYPEISQEIKQGLADYFRPHNQKLEDLLEMKFNWN